MAQLGVAGELRNKACAPLHLNVEWQLSEPFDFRFVAGADLAYDDVSRPESV